MAITSWIILAIVAVLGLIIGITYIFGGHRKDDKLLGVAAIVIAMIVCGGIYWLGHNTASGKRAYKDQSSNFGGGINRTVTVYDFRGQTIKTYSGRFDIETGNRDYILFDDEKGKRHIVYHSTGTVIIDEN